MKKIYPYIASFLIVIFAVIPNNIPISTPKADLWPMCTLSVCFLGFLILTIRTNWMTGLIAVLALANCFGAQITFIPFVAYYSVVFCLYFFIICERIENWAPVFNCVSVLVLLNLFMFIFQQLGIDSLLNYKAVHPEFFGFIGQHMQISSFSVIASCLLLPLSPFFLIFPIVCAFFAGSAWTILTAGVGLFTYLWFRSKQWAVILLSIFVLFFLCYSISHKKFDENMSKTNGRVIVWQKTIKLANEHPIKGWGIGSYKIIFPQISKMKDGQIPWANAHNFFIQMAFEFGYPMTFLFFLFWLGLVTCLWLKKDAACVAGLMMMATDMLCHFPDREPQCVFIIIAFIALCLRRVSYGQSAKPNHNC